MQVVLPHLAAGFIPVELPAAAAHASIFALVACFVAGAWEAWVASPPAHLPSTALEHGWSGTSKGCSGSRCMFLLKFVCLFLSSFVMLHVRWVVVGLRWF